MIKYRLFTLFTSGCCGSQVQSTCGWSLFSQFFSDVSGMSFKSCVSLFLVIATYWVSAHRQAKHIGGWRQAEVPVGRPSTVNCTWGTFEQSIDHFGSHTGTFPQRYCLYDAWWGTAAKGGFHAPEAAPGPILFYTVNAPRPCSTGNEPPCVCAGQRVADRGVCK